MPSNEFTKEERAIWTEMLIGFNDELVISKMLGKFRGTNSTMDERTDNVVWRIQPYISTTFDGTDATNNFQGHIQLSVPSTLGHRKHDPWIMEASELRDLYQQKYIRMAAAQRLASDVNIASMNVAANEGTIVVKRTAAATGFTDLAACRARMNKLGIEMPRRCALLSSDDYLNMAANLAARQDLGASMASNAYKQALLPPVARFETYELDYANTLTAATATATINGADQFYTPAATSQATSGETSNKDNRYQTINITVAGGDLVAKDCFTVPSVFEVHHITKQTQSSLKTVRVIEQVSGTAGQTGAYKISPPFISNGGGTDAEAQRQNVSATPANGAALTFLNTVTAPVNPFFHKDAIEIRPGSTGIGDDTDAGVGILRGTTDNGIELVFQKQYDIDIAKYKYRVDMLFGVTMLQPEMAGIMLFSQT